MKPFQAQTFYELLEVSVSASSGEIRAAFERLDRLFQEGQNALYGLADTGHQTALRKRMKEAVDVLTDEELRALYDQEIGLPPRDVAPPPPPPPPAPLKLEPDPPAPIPSAPEPPPVPVLAQMPDVQPPPTVVEAHQPVKEEAPEAGQMSMGDLLANVDATSTRPVAFTYERAGPPPPEPKSAIVPNEPVVEAVAPPLPPPPELPKPAEPRPPSSAPRPSGPKVYNPRASAPRALAPQIASDSALATISSAPRPSGPSRPLASELPKLPDIPPDAEFNGELLRTVRTALGISVPQLAERTRIGGKHIENVEADRYGALPAPVYLRGILMSIAKELGLDGIRVARSYLKLYEAARPKG
ncbi:MAG: helix-turn-helix domain-containing protein [Myxococcaceae bacterium]